VENPPDKWKKIIQEDASLPPRPIDRELAQLRIGAMVEEYQFDQVINA
jgi:hypothetical protein